MPTEAPTLETPRLRLRAHQPLDWEVCIDLWTNPDVVRFIGGGAVGTRQDIWFRLLRYAGLWQMTGYGYWLVEERSSGDFVGDVGIADFRRDMTPPITSTPEAGWVLHPKHHGKGYATEAMQAVLGWADEQSLPASFCIIAPDNLPSLRVANKLGYRPAGEASLRGETIQLLKR
ncbi:MAG: GNAT family N-acetyltransferase [Elstera sp.]